MQFIVMECGIYCKAHKALLQFSLACQPTNLCQPITTATVKPILPFIEMELGICFARKRALLPFSSALLSTFRHQPIMTATAKPMPQSIETALGICSKAQMDLRLNNSDCRMTNLFRRLICRDSDGFVRQPEQN